MEKSFSFFQLENYNLIHIFLSTCWDVYGWQVYCYPIILDDVLHKEVCRGYQSVCECRNGHEWYDVPLSGLTAPH